MGKYFLSSFVIVFWISCNVTTQKAVKTTETKIQFQHKVVDFYVDELDYIYIITDENVVHRCDQDLQVLYTYSNKRLGPIYSMDVSNPLKLIVYFREYKMVVTLDNTLTESSILDLNPANYQDIKAIGLSTENQLWIYNAVEFKLQKIDQNGKLLLESQSILQENIDPIDPDFLYEATNHVYLIDKDKGQVIVYNDYGKYRKVANLEMLSYQVLRNGTMIIDDASSYIEVDLLSPLSEEGRILQKSQQNVSKFHIQNKNMISLYKDKTIDIKPML